MGTAFRIMRVNLILLLLVAIIQADSNCCSPSSSSNCCQESKCCDYGKLGDCCKDKCTPSTCTPPTCTPLTCTPSTCTPPTCTPPTCTPCVTPSPTSAPPQPSPAPPGPSPPSSASSSSNINNAHTIHTNLKIDNAITNTNKIYVPITISNVNTNSLSCSGGSCQKVTQRPDVETVGPLIDTTTRPTAPPPILVPVPQPYPVAVPQPYPVHVREPYPVPVPYAVPQTQGCCVVIQPCVEMYCNQHRRVCGDQCTHSVMYQQHNPCHEHGCSKRSHWTRKACHETGHYPFINCGYVNQDCSQCQNDFYTSYHSYEQCHGCFY